MSLRRGSNFLRESRESISIYIQELAELAGINEPIRRTYYKGNEHIDEVTPKYALPGTHAARRTFISNALSSACSAIAFIQTEVAIFGAD